MYQPHSSGCPLRPLRQRARIATRGVRVGKVVPSPIWAKPTPAVAICVQIYLRPSRLPNAGPGAGSGPAFARQSRPGCKGPGSAGGRAPPGKSPPARAPRAGQARSISGRDTAGRPLFKPGGKILLLPRASAVSTHSVDIDSAPATGVRCRRQSAEVPVMPQRP